LRRLIAAATLFVQTYANAAPLSYASKEIRFIRQARFGALSSAVIGAIYAASDSLYIQLALIKRMTRTKVEANNNLSIGWPD